MTVFICTTEDSGVDRYSRELAELLPVHILRTRRYKLGVKGFSLVKRLRAFREPVHFTNQHFGRFTLFARFPYIITVHDLERMFFPFSKETLLERIGLKLDSFAIRRASHVIAVSANTKADLIRYLHIPSDKITIVHNGVDHRVFRQNGSHATEFPYILYVGSERPRKNLKGLLNAFAHLKKLEGFHGLKLVKVGSAGRTTAFRKATLQTIRELGLEGDVIFTENVTDWELSAYYSSARALVYPSLYEGFGFPVLEAMASGCPVITSNVSSLPEVSGGAALLVNPYSDDELYTAMSRLLQDDTLRSQLIAKGRARSREFSWARAAGETRAVYDQVESSVKVHSNGHLHPEMEHRFILSGLNGHSLPRNGVSECSVSDPMDRAKDEAGMEHDKIPETTCCRKR